MGTSALPYELGLLFAYQTKSAINNCRAGRAAKGATLVAYFYCYIVMSHVSRGALLYRNGASRVGNTPFFSLKACPAAIAYRLHGKFAFTCTRERRAYDVVRDHNDLNLGRAVILTRYHRSYPPLMQSGSRRLFPLRLHISTSLSPSSPAFHPRLHYSTHRTYSSSRHNAP